MISTYPESSVGELVNLILIDLKDPAKRLEVFKSIAQVNQVYIPMVGKTYYLSFARARFEYGLIQKLLLACNTVTNMIRSNHVR
jgi:hypothetical protein